MTEEEKQVIRAFAEGKKELQDQAIAIHRKNIPLIGARGTPEQDFMAEVDNPVPDYILRALYRRKLLEPI